MKTNAYRVLVASALLPVAALTAHGADLFSPALPAMATQTQTCNIINVSANKLDVTTEMINSTGASSSGGPLAETLAPGEAGGFALPGYYASFYCKFTVKGSASDVRASISVWDTNAGTVVAALPAL